MKKILGILILCLVCCGFTVNSDEDKKNACEFKSNAFQSCSLNENGECECQSPLNTTNLNKQGNVD